MTTIDLVVVLLITGFIILTQVVRPGIKCGDCGEKFASWSPIRLWRFRRDHDCPQGRERAAGMDWTP